MDIELRVHLEPVDDAGWVWWADSPQLPGFSAAADHLPDLLAKANEVIREERLAPEGAKVTPLLVSLRPSEPAAVNEATPPSSIGTTEGPEQRQAVNTRALVAA